MLGQHMIGILILGSWLVKPIYFNVGWRGEEGEKKLMDILVTGLDEGLLW